MTIFSTNLYHSLLQNGIIYYEQNKKIGGYYYIIIGILLILFSLNRLYKKRIK